MYVLVDLTLSIWDAFSDWEWYVISNFDVHIFIASKTPKTINDLQV